MLPLLSQLPDLLRQSRPDSHLMSIVMEKEGEGNAPASRSDHANLRHMHTSIPYDFFFSPSLLSVPWMSRPMLARWRQMASRAMAAART